MPTSLNPHDDFFFILMRLRLGLLNKEVADRFDISPTKSSNNKSYFYNLDKTIEQVLKKFSCLVVLKSNSR